jgi:hypothetical protein
VVQEAVATGDPELLQLVLERRDFQRYSSRIGGIPELLQKLKEVSIEPCIIISLHKVRCFHNAVYE